MNHTICQQLLTHICLEKTSHNSEFSVHTVRRRRAQTFQPPKKSVLTSMGLIGVDGKGCRYSGCKMCPARAVSIFKTLMGRRLAWREGSAGETELWTESWRIVAAPFSPEEPLSQAGLVLFLRTETVGAVIMTQFSWKLLRDTCVESK